MYVRKRREPCVLFLEAAFGTKTHPQTLKQAGWTVECFGDHFRDPDGRISDNVKDPTLIRFCHAKQWVLVTTDRQMRYTHIETIKQTEVAIIATVNNKFPPEVWVQALINAKAKIERCVKKHPARGSPCSAKKALSQLKRFQRMHILGVIDRRKDRRNRLCQATDR